MFDEVLNISLTSKQSTEYLKHGDIILNHAKGYQNLNLNSFLVRFLEEI